MECISSRDGDGAFALAAVAAGEPGDSVVESAGAKVYLEQTAVAPLDDKVLDAAVDQAGGVQFQLGQQP